MKWIEIKYLRLLAFLLFFIIIGNLFSQVFFLATNSNYSDLLPEGQSQVKHDAIHSKVKKLGGEYNGAITAAKIVV